MRVPDDSAGRKTRCPKCSRALRVPAARPAKVAAAKAAPAAKVAPPTVDEVAPSGDEFDDVIVVDDEPQGRQPASASAEDDVLDIEDVQVVRESTDDIEIVEDETPSEDDVVVVDDEPAPAPAAARVSDPFAGSDVPGDMRRDVQAELTKGEKVVWVGRPSMTLMLAQAKAARIAGVAVLVAGVGLLAGMAFVTDGTLRLALAVFGVAGLAFGGLMTLAPKFIQRGQSKRAVYLLTNRRALVMENKAFGAGRVRAYTMVQLKSMQRQDSGKLKGAGDLIFEQEVLNTGTGRGRGGPQKRNHGFLMVENVKTVEKLIRETLVDRGIDKVLAPEQ
jgi:hypothetical protein